MDIRQTRASLRARRNRRMKCKVSVCFCHIVSCGGSTIQPALSNGALFWQSHQKITENIHVCLLSCSVVLHSKTQKGGKTDGTIEHKERFYRQHIPVTKLHQSQTNKVSVPVAPGSKPIVFYRWRKNDVFRKSNFSKVVFTKFYSNRRTLHLFRTIFSSRYIFF